MPKEPPGKYQSGGVLGPVFSWLRRPGLAVTEGTKRVAVDHGGLEDFIKGAGAGLAGKSSVSGFSDVLAQRAGRESPNRLESIVGLGLDVLGDPLTYTGAGVTKGISREVALGEAVREASLKKGLAAGAFDSAVDTAFNRIKSESPSEFYVKFAGKDLVRSTKVVDKANTLLDAVVKNPEGNHRTLAKAFSRSAELPYGLNRLDRLNAMNSTANFEREIKPLIDIGSNLTEDEASQIAVAMSKGQINALKGISPAVPDNPAGFRDLADYGEFYSKFLKDWGQREVQLGLRDPKKLVTDYVPRYLKGNLKNIERDTAGGEKFVRIPSANSPAVSTRVKAITQDFDSLKDRGFEPITDIRGIMGQRGAKHYAMVSRAKMMNDAFEMLATPVSKANKDSLYSRDYVPVSNVRHPVAGLDKYKGQYIPRPVADALNGLQKTLDSDRTSAKMMRGFDKVLNEWKFITTATPQTRIRNMMSDFIMNLQAGVNRTEYYSKAKKIIKYVEDNDAADLLTSKNMPKGVTPTIRPNAPRMKIGELNADSQEIWKLFTETGGKAGFISSDLYRDLLPYQKGVVANALAGKQNTLANEVGEVISKGSRGYGRFKQWAGEQSGKQEDFMRLAHFTKALEDELPKGITSLRDQTGAINPKIIQAAERANDKVRKFNFDYGNLTQFEQRTAKRLVPFYSFMRQAIPQQVEMLFTRPGFMAAYPKGTNFLSGFLSADGQVDDPLVPEWIRELSPFQVASAKAEQNSPVQKALRFLYGGAPGDSYVGTLAGTPVETLNRLQPVVNTVGALAEGRAPSVNESLGAGFKELGASFNPMIKSPFELATGKNVFTGQDISEQGWGEYLSSLTPVARVGYAGATEPPLTGGQGLGGGLTRFLTGVDIRAVTQGARKAEAFNKLDSLTDEYAQHSRKTSTGTRKPTDSRGKELKKQINQLQKFVQDGGSRRSSRSNYKPPTVF